MMIRRHCLLATFSIFISHFLFSQATELIQLKIFEDEENSVNGKLYQHADDSAYVLILSIFSSPIASPASMDVGIFDQIPVSFNTDFTNKFLIYDQYFNTPDLFEVNNQSIIFKSLGRYQETFYFSAQVDVGNGGNLMIDPSFQNPETIYPHNLVFGFSPENQTIEIVTHIQNPFFVSPYSVESYSGFSAFFDEQFTIHRSSNAALVSDGHLVSIFNLYNQHIVNFADTVSNIGNAWGYGEIASNLNNGGTTLTEVISPIGNVINHNIFAAGNGENVYRTGVVRGNGTPISADGSLWQTVPNDSLGYIYLTKESANGSLDWSTYSLGFNNNNADTTEAFNKEIDLRTFTNQIIEKNGDVFVAQSSLGSTRLNDSLIVKDFFETNTKYFNIFNNTTSDTALALIAYVSNSIFKLNENGDHLATLSFQEGVLINTPSFQSSSFGNNANFFKVGDKFAWTLNYHSVSDTIIDFIKQISPELFSTTDLLLPAGYGALIIWLNDNLEIVDNWVLPYSSSFQPFSNRHLRVEHISAYQGDTLLIQGNLSADVSTTFDMNSQAPNMSFERDVSFIAFYSAPSILITSEKQNDALVFSVYPNPSSGSFAISLPSEAEGSYTITDLSGRTVERGLLKKEILHTVIASDGMASGVYLVSVNVDGKVATQKLVVP